MGATDATPSSAQARAMHRDLAAIGNQQTVTAGLT
jgi:hypothetical protein